MEYIMHQVISDLLIARPVVTDGSWGTQMQARGLKRGESPDSWNLTNPDQVESVAQSYVDAGSRIILTNTFGSNPFVLDGFGLADRFEEINRLGVEISKRAAGDKAKVFASMGPCGKMLVTGDVTEDQLMDAFSRQAKAQADSGADGIVVETMMDLTECLIALRAAKETGLPVVASMVYDAGKEKDRTMMGNTPEQAAEELTAAGADAVGANCGQGIEGFLPICKRLRASTDLPVWIKPNAGLPELIEGQVVYRATPQDFAAHVPGLLEAGADFIGGCCGTNQDFIKALSQLVQTG
jgi:5-methyltetrahydrofolate--homocysteine methyltransferase